MHTRSRYELIQKLKIRERFFAKVRFWGVVAIIVILYTAFGVPPKLAELESGDWSSYLGNDGGTGYNPAETSITSTSAPKLKPYWHYDAKSTITTQPVEANGLIYWGSWDGKEHATNLKGQQVWSVDVGKTTDRDPDCSPNSVGVASTATVAPISISGTITSVVFVGGGNDFFYALNASTGAIIWRTFLGPQPFYFIWGSPALYNQSVYIGISSFGDCPLVQGKLLQLDAVTGAVQHSFSVVPDDCVGGGVWGSPVIDQVKGTIYFVTGDDGGGGVCRRALPYVVALVELRASDLTFLSSWQVPSSKQVGNGDFGSTPTLFQTRIKGVDHSMIGVANKNGLYYAFDRDAISKGPLWKVVIANGGAGPEEGQGSISPSAWDGTNLYVAGGKTTIDGVKCQGSLRALNPATGAFLWEKCMKDGPVLGAVTAAPGVVAVGEGPYLVVVASASGKTLFTYAAPGKHSIFYGAACISNGVLYIGNVNGELYAFRT